MDTEKTPFRYLLGMWKGRSNYPTKTDVLYELYVYVLKNMKNQEFSEQTFNGIWCDATGVANWKDSPHEPHINNLLKDGTFEKTRESGGKIWYKIAEGRNPFV